MLEGRLRPVTSLVKVPVILTGAAETASGPLAEIHGRARQALAAEPALWDVSILNVFPFADDAGMGQAVLALTDGEAARSEEHTSELQSLMRISYAVFCLKQKRHHKRSRYPYRLNMHNQTTTYRT